MQSGLSQERLASDAQVDRSYLGSLERRTENPSVAVLDRIAEVLDVPLARLFMPAPEGTLPRLKAGERLLKKESHKRSNPDARNRITLCFRFCQRSFLYAISRDERLARMTS